MKNMIYFVVAFYVVIIFCSFMLYRNEKVFQFKMQLLDEVSARAKQDINENKDFAWRYDALRSVPYKVFMRRFWVPLKAESFYSDVSFLDK